MDYMAVLQRGWELTWKHKFLWVLGFLAALGGGGLNANYNFGSGDFAATPTNFTPEMVTALTAGALAFACIAVIVGILLWLVSLASRGGLITSVAALDRGEDSRFGLAFRQGWRKLLPLVGMTLLVFAVVIILTIVYIVGFTATLVGAIASVMSGGSEGLTAALVTASLAFFCLGCILIPLTLVTNMIYAFAYRGIMLRDMRVMDAIRHGWQVLRDNLGPILLLSVPFAVLGLIIFVISIVVLPALGIGSAIFMMMMTGGEPTTGQMIVGGLGFLAAILVFAAISAVLTAWRSATFTLAYNQWTGKEPVKTDEIPPFTDPAIS